jgi:hypothetical protein
LEQGLTDCAIESAGGSESTQEGNIPTLFEKSDGAARDLIQPGFAETA